MYPKKYCKSVSWYNKRCQAKKGAKLLQPTTDTITDENGNVVTDIEGKPKEVYGFDVPVPALDKEFDLALIGTKGKWYNHKVSVSNPVKAE